MIGFFVKKLSDYQYFAPLNKFLLSNGIETTFFSKDKFLFQKTKPLDKLAKSNCSFVFSVDCDYLVDYDFSERNFEHILIQNYHDFAFSAQRKETKSFYDNCDYFWVENRSYGRILKKFGKFKVIVSILPNYWRYIRGIKESILEQYAQHIDNENKLATCFLPKNKSFELPYVKNLLITPEPKSFNSGPMMKFVNHALTLGRLLEEEGFTVFYKQRPEHRYNVSVKNHIVSDNLYPNESMDLAYISKFGYGYMTSALMYFQNFNKKYINFENTNYPRILKEMFDVGIKDGIVENMSIEQNFEDIIEFINVKHNTKEANPSQRIKRAKNKILELVK